MKTTTNFWLAADYINAMLPMVSGEFRPDHGPDHDDRRLVTRISALYENMPGRVSFRIYRSRFMSKDIMGCVVKRAIAALGVSYVRTCTNDTETYAWQLSATRSIVIWHKEKVGTFIQLRDDGASTGVIA